MRGMVSTGSKGRLCRIVICHSMSNRNRDPVFYCGTDKFQCAGFFRCHSHQLDTAFRCRLQPTEHIDVRGMEIIRILRTLLRHREKRPLQMRTCDLCAARISASMRGNIFTDFCQLFLRQGHAGRANIGNALTQFVICDPLQTFRCGIAEIFSHASMEVDIHQTGNDITAVSAQDLLIPTDSSDQRAIRADIPGNKSILQVKDLSSGYSHTDTPAATSLLRAS